MTFSLVVLLSSCLDQYERDVVGLYKIEQFEFIDSTKLITYDLPTLTMKANKTFTLDFTDKKIQGKWEADDNGDWTIAHFQVGERDIQGQIGINEIKILNPWQFDCPFLKAMVFTKQSKVSNLK